MSYRHGMSLHSVTEASSLAATQPRPVAGRWGAMSDPPDDGPPPTVDELLVGLPLRGTMPAVSSSEVPEMRQTRVGLEATCGGCLRFSPPVTAPGSEAAWEELKAQGWRFHVNEYGGRGYALCPACVEAATTSTPRRRTAQVGAHRFRSRRTWPARRSRRTSASRHAIPSPTGPWTPAQARQGRTPLGASGSRWRGGRSPWGLSALAKSIGRRLPGNTGPPRRRVG